MKTMYRGVRLKPEQLKTLASDGMRYYWKDPEESTRHLFTALEDNNKISKLGCEPHLRQFILEGCNPERIQMFATDDKKNANSYARWTPELVFLALDWCRIDRDKIQRYLNKRYGDPYVVTFEMEVKHPEIIMNNERIGDFVSAIHIQNIEKVDLKTKDPLYESFAVL